MTSGGEVSGDSFSPRRIVSMESMQKKQSGGGYGASSIALSPTVGTEF
jgi:hypothetical protein